MPRAPTMRCCGHRRPTSVPRLQPTPMTIATWRRSTIASGSWCQTTTPPIRKTCADTRKPCTIITCGRHPADHLLAARHRRIAAQWGHRRGTPQPRAGLPARTAKYLKIQMINDWAAAMCLDVKMCHFATFCCVVSCFFCTFASETARLETLCCLLQILNF